MTSPDEPSARSAAERRLERIHAGEDTRREELRQELDDVQEDLARAEVELARAIAGHPLVSADTTEILEWCTDGDDLCELARHIFPD